MEATYIREIRAVRLPWADKIALRYAEIDRHAREIFVAEAVLREVPDGVEVTPTLKISGHMAQELMDDLWQCGLRPSEGTGSAGQLAATERHLEDMRRIVAVKLGTELEKRK